MFNKLAQDVINDNMMSYASYVLTNRALPDLRDGLKPVARRIIYSMLLNNTTKLTKSATVTGKVYELHAHGDTYGSLVNLVQKDRQNIPFLVGKGSWGQFTSNRQGAAASRYTEVKLGRPAIEMTKELKNNAIDMIPNYDGTIMVPEVLPVTWPVILTNHSSGIGVGFSSSSVSFNLHDIKQVVENMLNKRMILFNELIPDFATGGQIVDNDKTNKGLEKIFNEGTGSFTMRSKAKIEGNKIIVYELPFGIKREEIIDKIIKLSKDKKLSEVKDVRDGTSFTGMKIVITLKNNVNAEETLQKLFLLTPMESSISVNMNILDEGYPRVMGVKEVLNKWIEWRKSVIIRSLNDEINKKEKELHRLLGLEKILVNIDEVIKIIRYSKDEYLISNLKDEFSLDDAQAEYIVNIKLRNINQEKIEEQVSFINSLKEELENMINNVNDEEYIDVELIKRMEKSIKIMNVPTRRTTYEKVKAKNAKVLNKVAEAMKEEENYKVSVAITEQGYLYKRKRTDSVKGTKDIREAMITNDKILQYYEMDNNDAIYVAFDEAKIGKIKLSEVDQAIHIKSHFDVDLKIFNTFAIDDYEYSNKLLLFFADGQVVKLDKKSFETNRKMLNNAYYFGADLILFHELVNIESFELDNGRKKKIISSDDVNLKKGRISKGQNFIKQIDKGVTVKIV